MRNLLRLQNSRFLLLVLVCLQIATQTNVLAAAAPPPPPPGGAAPPSPPGQGGAAPSQGKAAPKPGKAAVAAKAAVAKKPASKAAPPPPPLGSAPAAAAPAPTAPARGLVTPSYYYDYGPTQPIRGGFFNMPMSRFFFECKCKPGMEVCPPKYEYDGLCPDGVRCCEFNI